MPHPGSSSRFQKAVLWAANGTDRNGEVKVDAAIEIMVRWETKQGELLNPQGNTILFEEMAVVGRSILIGSIMWLGALADVATPPTNLRQVIDFTETPDVKNRHQRRTVKMIKYSNELPTLA